MSQWEYAKLITGPVSGTIYGLRAVVTIPSESWIGWKVKTRGNGFLDAYLSLDRGTKSHYECGLSQGAAHATHYGLNDRDGDSLWHYMGAAGDEGTISSGYSLAPGRQVPIELSINSSDQLVYKVDNNTVKTYKAITNTPITNARVVIGICEEDYNDPANIPQSPLTKWGTFTNQIAMRNIAYQATKGGTWNLVNYTGNKFKRVYWPPGFDHQTVPQDIVVSAGNGSLIASLKKA